MESRRMKTLRMIAVPVAAAGVAFILYRIFSGAQCAGLLRHLRLFTLALFLATLLTPAMGWVANRVGALDNPGDRKIHKIPTPLLGGAAVFGAFFLSHVFQMDFTREMTGLFIAGFLMLAVGTIDDVKGGLPSSARLLAQVAASLIVIAFGMRLNLMSHTWWGPPMSIALTVFWLVGITNAINFLDGVDGLASGLSASTSAIFFILAYRLNDPYLAFITVTLCGASLGFLIFNFKPARIFLGDGGAGFIGFTLAAFGVMGNWSGGNPIVSFSIPIIVLGVPIFDMIYTTVERLATGKARGLKQLLEYTGRDHLHHRLAGLGFNDIQTVLFICLVTLALGFGASVIPTAPKMTTVYLMMAQAVCVFVIITLLMLYGARRNGNGNGG